MCDALQLNWKLPNHPKPPSKHRGGDSNNNAKCADTKYTLRACSIQKRIETENRKGQPRKRGPKPRPKPLPMSKYRRKTANQRERQRMGEINTAFEKLREKVPTPLVTGKGRCEKMTKINILHVAISYIRALENLLDTGEVGVQEYGTSLIQSPFDQMPSPMSSSSEGSPTREQMSGSEDSGIVDEDDEDKLQCPDWTELTSTLEFPGQAAAAAVNKLSKSLPPPPKLARSGIDALRVGNLDSLLTSTRVGNLDTLLTSTRVGNLDTLLTQSVIIGSMSSSDKVTPLQPSSKANLLNRGFDVDQHVGDLFSDLNSSFDSLDGLVDFSHEDPFELFI